MAEKGREVAIAEMERGYRADRRITGLIKRFGGVELYGAEGKPLQSLSAEAKTN